MPIYSRYEKEDAILDLAPIAVLILAEQSLRARQTALDETVEALEAATADACRRLPYMPGAFRDGYDYDWIEDERRSLKDRELLMTHQDDEGNEYSPFINFLQDQLKTLGLFQDDQIDFSFGYRGATPDYAVPARLFAPIVGLEPENEADQDILERIQDGQIDLRDVDREIRRRKQEISALERLHGCRVVIAADKVVTVYRPSRRTEKRLLRGQHRHAGGSDPSRSIQHTSFAGDHANAA